MLEELECGVKGEPETEEVGEEQNPGEREVGLADEEGEGGREDGEAEMLGDEEGVVGEERGVEGVLDAGDVEASVFGEWVIALDEERDEGEGGDEREPQGVFPGRGLRGGGYGGAREDVVHRSSLAGSGRYNEGRTNKQR